MVVANERMRGLYLWNLLLRRLQRAKNHASGYNRPIYEQNVEWTRANHTPAQSLPA